MINPRVFESLKAKAEQDLRARAELDSIVETLERRVAYAQGVLSRVHATPRARYPELLLAAAAAVADEVETIGQLNTVASQHPYYKFSGRWTRHLQDAIFTVLLAAWLGAGPLGNNAAPGELGRLLTLEEVGGVFGVPVEVDHDTFHIALEEYLAALTALADELSRLAMNAVTLGDGALAVRISRFVKDLHAGFQLLNLKNDFLRKKVDGVKYAVKKVEGVIYDLALRNLLPAEEGASSNEAAAAAATAPAGDATGKDSTTDAAAAPATPADSKMSEA
ncbi:recombination hotspot-binding protein [Niveomyces insectorum RCEF 264]|uniref:Recombination hotspot-binding protein n=1 Tax=Niveomyces insectorum RCEF 264 TaxID=1081102 RepID=A0A167S123_9HYPO|nr:recombination hotspot-binding protein [Niveomyces insectorum RCEF 264]